MKKSYVSLQDTAVAYQALTAFARRARILDITGIDVLVDLIMTNVMTVHQHRIRIGNHSLVPASHLKVSIYYISFFL